MSFLSKNKSVEPFPFENKICSLCIFKNLIFLKKKVNKTQNFNTQKYQCYFLKKLQAKLSFTVPSITNSLKHSPVQKFLSERLLSSLQIPAFNLLP